MSDPGKRLTRRLFQQANGPSTIGETAGRYETSAGAPPPGSDPVDWSDLHFVVDHPTLGLCRDVEDAVEPWATVG